MNDRLVSIIVPVYNSEEYIEKCVLSLLGQTYGDIEIIVVDDGSNDGSADIVRSIAEKDSRVRLFSQENSGASAARNLGISKANGRWMTFADSDDRAEPEHISALVGAVGDGCECSVCGYYIDLGNSVIARSPDACVLSPEKALEEMLMPDRFQGFLWNKLFDAVIIREYDIRLDTEIHCCEDLLFCAEYFRHCSGIRCIPDTGYHYCQRAESAVRGLCDTEERIARRMTAVTALKKTERFCGSKRTLGLCKAKQQTELAEVYFRISSDERVREVKRSVIRQLRRRVGTVIFSPLSFREKLKYLLTAVFPKIMEKRRAARERYTRQEGQSE